MKAFIHIEKKLSLFYKKFYTNELIKGSILFCLLGVLYFLFTVYLEFFFWLKPTYRTILFWGFVLVEFFLFLKFIIIPITQLIKLKKGINEIDSSKIIGDYFPEVQDKLLNILQLKKESKETALLIASIEQKSKELQTIQFTKAVSFKKNYVYLKYLILPVFIWLLSFLTETNIEFSKSFTRVVNHQTIFKQPTPFSFHIEKNKLRVIEGDSHTIRVTTKGDLVPEEVKISYNKQAYFMEEKTKGVFIFTFTNVVNSIDFQLESGDVLSSIYRLDVLNTPIIKNILINLDYPRYTKKTDEKIDDTGNILVPEGTKIVWQAATHQVDTVAFIENKKRRYFLKQTPNSFSYEKTAIKNIQYQISSSNNQLKDFEKLSYNLQVIKDESPKIFVESNVDSLQKGDAQFAGQISDDYGISKLNLIYYNIEQPDKKKRLLLEVTKENIQTFFYQFPNKIKLEKGIDYEIYFQVSDNDAINGEKTAISKKFKYRQKTKGEFVQEQLQEQKQTILNLEKSIQSQQQQKKNLEKIQNEIQNKKNINWSDKKKIEEFIERQKQYEQMMERQTENLQESLQQNKEEKETLTDQKKELQKRIQELLKLNKQKKLLAELQKMAEKLDKEELVKKAKELAQQNKQQERSLERILELTKRFYVEEKTMQIANKLEKLSKKQDSINNNKKNVLEKQQDIRKEFNEISKELEELSKDNEKLKEPMEIPQQEEEKKEIDDALSKTEEKLNRKEKKEAKKEQRKASKKMKQMSQKMLQAMSDMQSNSISENIDDLRKILENLITFSFKQEKLLIKFDEISVVHPDFGKELKKQNELKTYFEHIDDSLFVLSMRLPKLSSKIQTELSNTHYNLDLSLENFSENRFDNGGSNQQYVMTSVNNLSDFLSDLLSNLQNKMGSSGKGDSGNPFNLPSLIEKQKGISEQLKKGLKKGKEGKEEKNKGEKGNKGVGDDEKLNGELFKIYQQQNILRAQLKDAIKEGGDNSGEINKVLKTMEKLENDILEKGFNQETLQRMQQLEYELLKLDKATLEQGIEKKRKSNTNNALFQKKRLKQLKLKKRFYNQIEILNRQSLPLHEIFEKRVQKYFSKKTKE